MTSADLARAIGSAGWSALLPEHRADGDGQPLGRPTCVAAQPLADGLVLAVVADEGGRTYPAPLVVTGEEVRRARPGDGAGVALVSMLSADRSVGGFELTAWHHEPVSGERGITVDQTNESVIVGERAVVKWAFLAGECQHPAPSMLAELERNGFTGMPRRWGAVQWRPSDGSPPRLLALVTEFVPGAVDGWTWVVDDLRNAASHDDERFARDAGRAVGDLVASFHRALAGTARRSTPDERAAWRSGAVAELDRAMDLTRGSALHVLRSHERQIRAAFGAIPTNPTTVMRVHGDMHVGQVMRSDAGASATYVLVDFDGNPVVSPTERLAEQPAALDVAGMAQSFVHAGLVVRKHNPTLHGETVDRMAATARSTFLDAYSGGPAIRTALLDERLLRPFALRQVCRELIYAATHLPRWSYVPEAALPMLLREEST